MTLHRVIFAVLPIVWLGAVASMVSLFGLRNRFGTLRMEHSTAQRDVSQSGDSLSDRFEYMAAAAVEYADALDTFIIFGCAPALLLLLVPTLIGNRAATNFTSTQEFREETQ